MQRKYCVCFFLFLALTQPPPRPYLPLLLDPRPPLETFASSICHHADLPAASRADELMVALTTPYDAVYIDVKPAEDGVEVRVEMQVVRRREALQSVWGPRSASATAPLSSTHHIQPRGRARAGC
ncbi:hypothetical protein TRIUR3_03747 [Triticum urartu]|uniref:Uncharacterized protein n=1 Tax=Triticum urartu TaxID=4572 RepID=M8AF76_TRIUA|nr:hypothetical protein TRIUR3_03747 [Triticum urartu]